MVALWDAVSSPLASFQATIFGRKVSNLAKSLLQLPSLIKVPHSEFLEASFYLIARAASCIRGSGSFSALPIAS